MSDSMYGFSNRDMIDASRYFSDKIVAEEASYYDACQKGESERDCAKERELTFMRIASHCIKKEIAINKEIPVRPTHVFTNDEGFTVGLCCVCQNGVGKAMKYCDWCGQKLDWEVDSNV